MSRRGARGARQGLRPWTPRSALARVHLGVAARSGVFLFKNNKAPEKALNRNTADRAAAPKLPFFRRWPMAQRSCAHNTPSNDPAQIPHLPTILRKGCAPHRRLRRPNEQKNKNCHTPTKTKTKTQGCMGCLAAPAATDLHFSNPLEKFTPIFTPGSGAPVPGSAWGGQNIIIARHARGVDHYARRKPPRWQSKVCPMGEMVPPGRCHNSATSSVRILPEKWQNSARKVADFCQK